MSNLPVMIDGGACVGRVLQSFVTTHQIYAFEPNHINFKKLFEDFHQHKHVHLMRAALGKQHGKRALLYCPTSKVESQGNSLIPTKTDVAGAESYSVGIVSLSTFMKNKGIVQVDVLKLDIEGGEYDVLEDLLDNQVINQIGTIYVEFHAPVCIPNMIDRHNEVLSRLKREYQGDLRIYNWDHHCYEQFKQ